MLFSGKAIQIEFPEAAIARLVFDLRDHRVNKLSKAVLRELDDAISIIEHHADVKALVISSNKKVFITGADVTEFTGSFTLSEQRLLQWITGTQDLFNRIEDLAMPTVTAINGYALGGGCELALATDYRVMATSAHIGLPEVKLGIFPGWGGTVRLPRLIGADNALEWICSGTERNAQEALAQHAVDAVTDVDQLQDAALHMIKQCLQGRLDYQKRKQEKRQPLLLNPAESILAFESAKAIIATQSGRHFPAPMAALKTVQRHATLSRDQALRIEAQGFVKIAKTDVARNLVGLFLNQQRVKKTGTILSGPAQSVKRAAVLGAGIMGRGIACQSAYKGIPVIMQDIRPKALASGLEESGKLLMKQVQRGKLKVEDLAAALNRINTASGYSDFSTVDLVIEAVVENQEIKSSVLAEIERQVKQDCVITSNTSTVSISGLADALQRPELFCGMHFFNPVYRMPLVEIIRGKKSNDIAIATAIAYARSMGKTPIVVNDCPGFLVNRVLFAYLTGFDALVRDGADVRHIDAVMEKFGWPMGPAWLLDVVGIDTVQHASRVMASGYPDRMRKQFKSATDAMYENARYGQKNKLGFYKYEPDKTGSLKKLGDADAARILQSVQSDSIAISDTEIIDRMMLPMCMETVRCVEDGIVEHPLDADMGLILGIAFPGFRGGALRYIEAMGVTAFCERADHYSHISPIYVPTAKLRNMAHNNKTFYPRIA